MLLNNTLPRCIGPSFKHGTKSQITKGRKHLMLHTGINELTSDEWKAIKGSKFVQGYIDRDEFVVLGDGEKVENLSGLKAKEAIQIVKETFEEDHLLAWAENEKRASVLKAIDAQVSRLEVKKT